MTNVVSVTVDNKIIDYFFFENLTRPRYLHFHQSDVDVPQ